MEKKKVFVSFAPSADESGAQVARQVIHDLQVAGAEVVTADASIADDELVEYLDRELSSCQYLLLVQTPQAPQSLRVQTALHLAFNLVAQQRMQGVLRLLSGPVNSQAQEPPGPVQQSFDARRDYQQARDELLGELGLLPTTEHELAMVESLPLFSPARRGSAVPVAAGASRMLSPRPTPQAGGVFAPAPVPVGSAVPVAFADQPLPVAPRVPASFDHLELLPGWQFSRVRWRLVGPLLFLVALIPILLLLPSLTASAPPRAATRQVVGTATFFSSGMIGPDNTTGSNDGVRIDLSSLPAPRPGMSYYAWLLPDLSQIEGQTVFLGRLSPQHGQVHFQYTDASNRDLLAWTSRFLVTEDSASMTPDYPSSDRSAWKWYAEFPQKPNPADMMGHYSLLDHLRHLLVQQPDLLKMGLHGGLAFWLRQNTQKLLEWASAARGSSGVPQNPALMRRHFIRILDYLDGTAYVSADVPPATPPFVDPIIGQIGILTLDLQAMPPGYLRHVALHLEGLITSPGSTAAQRTLAGQLDRALLVVKGDLEQARLDAIKLLSLPSDRLSSSSALPLLDDLVEQCTNAYVGRYNAQGGMREGGVTWIADQIQHLATFEVLPYQS